MLHINKSILWKNKFQGYKDSRLFALFFAFYQKFLQHGKEKELVEL
jgi:hypothetical protein